MCKTAIGAPHLSSLSFDCASDSGLMATRYDSVWERISSTLQMSVRETGRQNSVDGHRQHTEGHVSCIYAWSDVESTGLHSKWNGR